MQLRKQLVELLRCLLSLLLDFAQLDLRAQFVLLRLYELLLHHVQLSLFSRDRNVRLFVPLLVVQHCLHHVIEQ